MHGQRKTKKRQKSAKKQLSLRILHNVIYMRKSTLSKS